MEGGRERDLLFFYLSRPERYIKEVMLWEKLRT